MQNNLQGSSTGLIVVLPQQSDYELGGYTGIKPETRVINWAPYLPEPEPQYGPSNVPGEIFDTMSCVSFSVIHAVEAQVSYLLSTGKVSAYQRAILTKYGFLKNPEDNKCKLSVRFTAITSETTNKGNWVQKVSEAVRLIGCIPDADLPFGGHSFDEYIQVSLITDDMKAKAQIFLQIFKIQHEWEFFDMDPEFSEDNRRICNEAITHAPLILGVPLPAGHAILMSKFDETSYTTLDQYNPFIFVHSYSYPINFAYKVYVEMQAPFTFMTNLTINERHPDVAKLQRLLNEDPYTRVAYTGVGSKGKETVFFGKLTENAVKKFQMKYRLPITGYVGPLTRAVLNQILAGNAPHAVISNLEKYNLRKKVLVKASDLIAKCHDIGLEIRITEGFRDAATQLALYNQGRTTPGIIVTDAKPGWSYHNYGLAFDICFATGEPYAGRDADFKRVASIAKEQCGLEWGGDFPKADFPHFQYTGGYPIEKFVNNEVDLTVFN